ncbi:MAG: hypothetical protein OXI87_17365 [Albidovulum sp.]|nr:hypothetical protein [Albidovulum sp.]
MKDSIGDYRKDVAPFRFGAASEALHLGPDEAARHLKRQSEREMAIPGSDRRKVAVSTMRDWIRAYRKPGFDELAPKRRKDRGSVRSMPGDVVEALPGIPDRPPAIASRPTKLQDRAFGLLGIDPSKTVAMQLAGPEGGVRAIPSANAEVFFFSFA